MKKTLSLILCVALALSALLGLASCGEKNDKLPIVCGENGMNVVAGVATYGVDYYSLGVKAGDMAADILLGLADPATTPVATDPNPALIVNEAVAAELGFTIPQAIKDRATGGTTQTVTRVDSAIIAENGGAADFTVGILQLVQHVALDLTNQGFVDQLSVRMDAADKTVKILDENASGDESNNVTIAEGFVTKAVDLIYTIATSSSQAAVAATEDHPEIPVIFNAVTNPVDAGLVASMDAPGANVTGVSDINPVEDQIALIAELLGRTDIKIGFLYTSSETNSQFQISLAKAYCDEMGYEYVDGAIVDINDLESTMVRLQNAGIDAIYIPTDNVIANGVANVHSINKGE